MLKLQTRFILIEICQKCTVQPPTDVNAAVYDSYFDFCNDTHLTYLIYMHTVSSKYINVNCIVKYFNNELDTFLHSFTVVATTNILTLKTFTNQSEKTEHRTTHLQHQHNRKMRVKMEKN